MRLTAIALPLVASWVAALPASADGVSRIVLLVENETAEDRPAQAVEVPWAAVQAALPALREGRPRLTDLDRGGPVPVEAADRDGDGRPDVLCFRTDLTARRTRGAPAPSGGADLTPGEPARTFLLEAASGSGPDSPPARGGAEPRGDVRDGQRSPVRVTIFEPAASGDDRRPSCWARNVAESMLRTYPDPRDFDAVKPGRWDYTTGFFLQGLMELRECDRNPRYLDYTRRWAEQFLDREGRVVESAFDRRGQALDDLLPGRVLLALHRATGDPRYRTAAAGLIGLLEAQPRTAEGGFWHKAAYPRQMWLDGAYMAEPFAAEYAALFGDRKWFDEAARQLTLLDRHTRDPRTGLMFHGWDESRSLVWANPETGASPAFWGRATGWYLMALVDVLDYLPKDHPRRADLVSILQAVSEAVARQQDPRTGLWFQVLDQGGRSDNWHETSATAMFARAFAKGARQGLLPPLFREAALGAHRGLLERHVYVDHGGAMLMTGTVKVGTLNTRVSKGDYAYYVGTERRVNDLKGVGAFVLASLELDVCGPTAATGTGAP